MRDDIKILHDPESRRRCLLAQDTRGPTPLFCAAGKEDDAVVRHIIVSFRGTCLNHTRLRLISIQDKEGLNAADVTEQHGHLAIARLLHSERDG